MLLFVFDGRNDEVAWESVLFRQALHFSPSKSHQPLRCGYKDRAVWLGQHLCDWAAYVQRELQH